eukprot:gb/GECG01000250.1/.p1 GENE.gb/GECG01000250.1/~~gb/GECG01000250.1/.p1  ORF type:complete len:137 (+),score=16.32 gb/GECG01000250.1/:1-411(+)
MSEGPVTVRTRKFMRNPLLQRRQMVVEVIHPGRAPVSKDEIRKQLAKVFKADPENIFCFGFKVAFGGGRSEGFGLIYDNMDAVRKFEPRFRLIRHGLAEKKKRTRKQWKDLKKQKRTTWGTGRRRALHKQKRAQQD